MAPERVNTWYGSKSRLVEENEEGASLSRGLESVVSPQSGAWDGPQAETRFGAL